jgi:hypothetical protein
MTAPMIKTDNEHLVFRHIGENFIHSFNITGKLPVSLAFSFRTGQGFGINPVTVRDNSSTKESMSAILASQLLL